jgi:tetratricopeptide (TPR) repeat protein
MCRRPSLLVALALFGAALTVAVTAAPEDEVRKAAARFADALARRDRTDYLAAWDRDSPRYPGRRGELSLPRVRGVKVRGVDVDGERAIVRLSLEEAPADGEVFARAERVVRLIRRDGAWKVWGCSSPGEDLLDTLGETASAEARKELLAAERRHLSLAGVHELNRRTREKVRAKDWPADRQAALVAEEAAAALGDVQAAAWARLHRGYLREAEGKGPEAQPDYEGALDTFVAAGQQQGEVVARLGLNRVLAARKEHAAARRHYEAARELYRELGYSVARADRIPGLAAHTFGLLDEQAELEDAIKQHIRTGEFQTAHAKQVAILRVELELFGPLNTEIAGTHYFAALIHARLGELRRAAG